ncbi:MAG: hypothetical protein ABI337_05915 [Nitrososphaera sp.]|jgi:hypothetical protein
MQYSTKSKIATAIGIVIIAAVASLFALPFIDTSGAVQKIPQKSMQKVGGAEQKLLDVIAHEKSELLWKINEKSP